MVYRLLFCKITDNIYFYTFFIFIYLYSNVVVNNLYLGSNNICKLDQYRHCPTVNREYYSGRVSTATIELINYRLETNIRYIMANVLRRTKTRKLGIQRNFIDKPIYIYTYNFDIEKLDGQMIDRLYWTLLYYIYCRYIYSILK